MKIAWWIAIKNPGGSIHSTKWPLPMYGFFMFLHCVMTIWANYNNSQTWIKAILGWFPLLTMIPVRSQWGRYNLPRYIVIWDDLQKTQMVGTSGCLVFVDPKWMPFKTGRFHNPFSPSNGASFCTVFSTWSLHDALEVEVEKCSKDAPLKFINLGIYIYNMYIYIIYIYIYIHNYIIYHISG